MKKCFVIIMTCAIIVMSALSASALKFSSNPSEMLGVDMSDTYTKGDDVMVPLRKTVENLGFEVEWNAEERSVYIVNGNVAAKLYIGNNNYYISGLEEYGVANNVFMTSPEIRDNYTYVPAMMLNIVCSRLGQ